MSDSLNKNTGQRLKAVNFSGFTSVVCSSEVSDRCGFLMHKLPTPPLVMNYSWSWGGCSRVREVERDMKRHLNLINPLFCWVVFPGSAVRRGVGCGRNTASSKNNAHRSSCLYLSQSVCLCYFLLPTDKEASVPRLHSALLKRTNPIVMAVNIPFIILWLHVLLKAHKAQS